MKRIFINDIPVLFKNLDNSKLKVENYDTLIDGSSGIIHTKLRARVLIYDALPDSIDSLLKIMTEKKLKKTYSVTFTLKNKKEVIKYLKKKFKVIKAGGGIVKLAGEDSGPPPKSGPTPHGLPYIAKNVRPIKERK